jgi:NADH-quinone oxidoreductase subunit C
VATAEAITALRERFPELNVDPQPLVRYLDGRDSGQMCVRVTPARLLEVMQFLYDDPRCKFAQLCDLCGIDYLNYPDATDRFGVVYSLVSHTHNHRLWIKVFVNDPEPTLPSVTSIWKGANWPEREIYDMFGIRFTGHPDLRRILMPQNFKDHPLRKDYPLQGKGEREDFERVTRETA